MLFLAAGGLLVLSLLIAFGASRIGIPSLVAFLIFGMLLGSDGPGGIEFSDASVAQIIGTAGLVLILFEGGLSTSWRRLRGVALPAVALSTLGVLITAALVGAAAYFLFDLPVIYALLLGAVVSSTDAAAVFASLRSSKIKRKLARTLEAESGINDPMAIALTIGLLSWLTLSDYGMVQMLELLAKQLGIGLVAGLVFGYIAVRILAHLPKTIGSFAPVVSLGICAITFGLTQVIDGSGFLAVYLVGLFIGSTPSRYRSHLTQFHEGVAFLAQVVMFVALGLFVNPAQLPVIAIGGVVLAVLLAVVVRPVAVYVSLLFSEYGRKEQFFLGIAGLRGAVPIVLGTFVLSSGVDDANKIFNIVFFVVLVSALFQGAVLEKIATRLGLLDQIAIAAARSVDPRKRASIQFTVQDGHAVVGSRLNELGLPKGVRIISVTKDGKPAELNSDFHLHVGDIVKVGFVEAIRPEVEDVIIRWHRRI